MTHTSIALSPNPVRTETVSVGVYHGMGSTSKILEAEQTGNSVVSVYVGLQILSFSLK